MKNTYSSLLAEELEPLQAQIKEVDALKATILEELGAVESELDALSGERQRYDALHDVCVALDRLDELEAGDLFWNALPEVHDTGVAHDRLRGQSGEFQQKVSTWLEKQEVLQSRIRECDGELAYLDGQIAEAFDREQRRQEEFVIEREVSYFPMRAAIMPWSRETESERYFRRAVLITMLFCLIFGGVVPLITIPVPERSQLVVEVPERIAMLVKKEVPPPPPPLPTQVEQKPVPDEPEKQVAKSTQPEKSQKAAGDPKEKKAARTKARSSGVLAFKDTFQDLIVDAPVAKLGTNSRINNKAPLASGQTRAKRSLVATQATGSSGGIAVSSESRNIGYGGEGGNGERIGGVAFARVESTVAGVAEQEGRPLSSGPGPARTDEEIQIVFDRYKATLYRIYNKELRKDPTLRGNILLRIVIEPNGEVSACSVDSTDLGSDELVDKIVERVKRFSFGMKEDVPKIAILYPIDFLPAG